MDGLKEDLYQEIRVVKTSLADLTSYTKEVSERVDTVESTLDDVQRAITELRLSQQGQKESMASMSTRVKIAESVEPTPPRAQQFDRNPDFTVIKINAKSNFAKDAVHKEVTKLCSEVSIDPSSFTLKGDGVSRFFTMQFKGTPNLASEKVSRVLGSLHVDGEWRKVLVADPTNHMVQIFMGPDKSQKQQKVEMSVKRLGGILSKAKVPDIFARRRDGVVLSKWQPLARVEVCGPLDIKLLWDRELVSQLELDTNKITEEFNALSSTSLAPNPTQWSS
jgi:hypothetical protein